MMETLKRLARGRTIDLISPPFAQFSTRLQLSELYTSGATIGTAQATVTGKHIEITQVNFVAGNLPTIACRTQLLDLGPLAAGRYDVTWTTAETWCCPIFEKTRVRTLSFVILPAEAIPA